MPLLLQRMAVPSSDAETNLKSLLLFKRCLYHYLSGPTARRKRTMSEWPSSTCTSLMGLELVLSALSASAEKLLGLTLPISEHRTNTQKTNQVLFYGSEFIELKKKATESSNSRVLLWQVSATW